MIGYSRATNRLEINFERISIYDFNTDELSEQGYVTNRIRGDYISYYHVEKEKEIIIFSDLTTHYDKGVTVKAKKATLNMVKQFEDEIERLTPHYYEDVMSAHEYFMSLDKNQ